MIARIVLFLSLAAGLIVTGAPALSVETVLEQMDHSAASFKSMTAKVQRVSHTAVINEDSVDSGVMKLKRARHDVRMLVELTEPDPKAVSLRENKLEVYYPKLKRIEEYDVGANRALLDQFLLIGFGTSGAELKAAYQVRLLGEQTVDGRPATQLELVPKSKEFLQRLKKLELWMSEGCQFPVRQKFFLPAGDLMTVTYTEVRLNPALADQELKFKAPRDVERVAPQK